MVCPCPTGLYSGIEPNGAKRNRRRQTAAPGDSRVGPREPAAWMSTDGSLAACSVSEPVCISTADVRGRYPVETDGLDLVKQADSRLFGDHRYRHRPA